MDGMLDGGAMGFKPVQQPNIMFQVPQVFIFIKLLVSIKNRNFPVDKINIQPCDQKLGRYFFPASNGVYPGEVSEPESAYPFSRRVEAMARYPAFLRLRSLPTCQRVSYTWPANSYGVYSSYQALRHTLPYSFESRTCQQKNRGRIQNAVTIIPVIAVKIPTP